MRKAEELIKAHNMTGNKTVKSDFKERNISVNCVDAFTQNPEDLKGSFMNDYSLLKFP